MGIGRRLKEENAFLEPKVHADVDLYIEDDNSMVCKANEICLHYEIIKFILRGKCVPFTPFHMGPGILIKSLLLGSFSLLVFGWTQIVMDIQPLVVLITGEGHLHGFTHTYFGAILIAVFSALTGKYLSELGLRIIGVRDIAIKWPIAFISAFIGSFSHVFIDSIMHSDLQPFYPVVSNNMFLGLVSVTILHKICLYTGLLGAVIYFVMGWKLKKCQNEFNAFGVLAKRPKNKQ